MVNIPETILTISPTEILPPLNTEKQYMAVNTPSDTSTDVGNKWIRAMMTNGAITATGIR